MPKSMIFDGAVVEQADVAGLDVAVHDAVLVGVGEPAADLHHDLELLLRGAGARPSAAALSRSAPGRSSIAMKGSPRSSPSSKTVTMFGCWSCAAALRLDLEALAALLVEGALGGEGLDGDLALEGLVEAAVDHAHAAPADAADHAVAADACVGRPSRAGRRGSIGSLLELEQDHGDVVLAAPRVGLGHQGLRPPSPRRRPPRARMRAISSSGTMVVRPSEQSSRMSPAAHRAGPACRPRGRACRRGRASPRCAADGCGPGRRR